MIYKLVKLFQFTSVWKMKVKQPNCHSGKFLKVIKSGCFRDIAETTVSKTHFDGRLHHANV